MQQSRLIQHLKALSQTDWRMFIQYVSSPYFNQNQRVQALVEYLHTCAPDFEKQKLLKKAIFPILFPKNKKVFSTQSVHDHFSMVLRLLEGFLAQKGLEASEWEAQTLLVTTLQKLGLHHAFERKYAQFISTNQQAQNLDTFYRQYRMHMGAYTRAQQVRDDTASDLLDETEKSLDRFYLVSKLKLGAERLNRSRIFKDSPTPTLDPMLELGLSQVTLLAEDPLLAVYGTIYKLYAKPEETARYDVLIELLAGVVNGFDKEAASETYAFALNYAIRTFNEGDASFISRIFELYKRLLELGLLTQDDGNFPHAMMKNVVTAGLRNKEFEWTRDFIEEYKEKIDPERRNDVYAYNMATYYFEQESYREALRGLSQTKFKDVFYELGARTLMVKIYYEMEEDDSIGYLLKAFRAALKRNKAVSPSYFKLFDNFLRFVDKLYKLKMGKKAAKQETWQKTFDELSYRLNSKDGGIANAMWLEEKLNALKMKNER